MHQLPADPRLCIRRFAPLDPMRSPTMIPRLCGVIFDVDGTLCNTQPDMFAAMRQALNIPKSTDILEHLLELPDDERAAGEQMIIDVELKALDTQVPLPGLKQLMDYLESRNIRKGICSRNFDISINNLLSKNLPDHKFYPILSRTYTPNKPSPVGLIFIAGKWRVPIEACLMVGDSIDDMLAGRLAGATTVLLRTAQNHELTNNPNTDLVIDSLTDLIPLMERGLESRPILDLSTAR